MRVLLAIAVVGCGTGAQPPAPAPVQDARVALTSLVRDSIAVGNHEACAIEATGKVACWGLGGAGEFGTPDDRDQPKPVELPGIASAVGLATSVRGACAWTTRGEVFCWDDNLDDNYALDRRPFQVRGLSDIVQVTVSLLSACGLHATGRVSCWDLDRDPLVSTVREVAGLVDAVEIAGADAAPYTQMCARLASGAVTCSDQGAFAVVPALAGATSISATYDRVAALLPGHRLVTWEVLRKDQVTIDHVDGERVVVEQAPGDSFYDHRACVLGSAATRCWLVPAGAPPAEEPARPAVRDLAFDNDVMCMRTGDHVRCAGRVGRLGDGSPQLDPAFVPVHGMADATQLEAIGRTTCALHATGHVACWGQQLAALGAREIGVDREPRELPSVDDALEIAMTGGIGNFGDHDDWAIACARRAHGATCWSTSHGVLEAHDAPELAGAVKLYSGTEVCGVSARDVVRCTHFSTDRICTRGATPYTDCKSYDDATEQHALEAQLGRALAHHSPLPEGMRATSDPDVRSVIGRADFAVTPTGGVVRRIRPHGPLVDEQGAPRPLAAQDLLHASAPQIAPPLDAVSHVVQLRLTLWVGEDSSPGVVCVRRDAGQVACWGERDDVGAGEHSTRSNPVEVAGVAMGEPRRVIPDAPTPPPPPPAAPTTPPTVLAPQPMRGPYRDVRHACEAQACPNHEPRTYCDQLADAYARRDAADTMPQPPAPFTQVALVSFDCRAPDGDYRDDLHRMRLMATRADGVWVSAPLFAIGKAHEPCSAHWHIEWATRGGRPVASVVAGRSCNDDAGGEDDAAALTIAAADAKRPAVYPAIPTATTYARSCLPSATGCDSSATTVELVSSFTDDGFALAGAAQWPAPIRDPHGMILGVGTASGPSAIGTYRFAAP